MKMLQRGQKSDLVLVSSTKYYKMLHNMLINMAVVFPSKSLPDWLDEDLPADGIPIILKKSVQALLKKGTIVTCKYIQFDN
jgi:hypothetical protein